eukprot:355464-Chlamydomonas_euryale.AAC.3
MHEALGRTNSASEVAHGVTPPYGVTSVEHHKNFHGTCARADIDVCLELPGVEDNESKSAIVERLGQLFTAAGMADVHAIPRARVPVCKARHAANGTCFDVTVGRS